MTGIVDYGMGNLLSVFNAFEMAGGNAFICSRPEELQKAERLVLPGVGAFRDCMRNLTEKGFTEVLDDYVNRLCRPVLGICLGMQAMARRGFEGGEFRGLGWFDADVVRLRPSDPSLRVPQIGWNDVSWRTGSDLFGGLPQSCDFYFVHSYYMKCSDDRDVEASCDYGGEVTAAVRKNNVFATQFHPEKSQDHGLKMIANFLGWRP